jgi:predicted PurR-regulated permease PerM
VTLSGSPERAADASGRWAALRARLRTVTPEALGRVAVAAFAIGAAVWLAVGTWPALLPFVAGAVLAYAVLPIANWLDRFMPRVLAAVLAELVALSIIVGVTVVIVPPLVNGLSLVASRLPPPAVVDQRLAEFQAQLGTLPEPTRTIVTSVATDVIGNLQGALQGFVSGLAAFITGQILGILETASFLLGLLVIPVWVLTVVADERRIKQRGAAAVAPAIRADVYALFRIVDRTLGTFLRVQVLAAIAVGALVWLGLKAAEALGLIDVPYEVTAGVLLGVPQVIPQLGFLLGFLPILLVLAVSGPQAFVVVLVVYVVANRVAGTLVNTSVSRGVLNVHPALMIPGLVAIGQLGLIPLLVGAPLIVIARDTVRYLNGRLGEPPTPANVLPGERGWAARRHGQAAAVVPSAYRVPAGAPATASRAFVPSVYRTPVTAPSPAAGATATPSMTPVTDWSTRP